MGTVRLWGWYVSSRGLGAVSALLLAAAAAGAPSAFAQTPVPSDGDGTVAGQQPGAVAPASTKGDMPKAEVPKPPDKPKLDSAKPAKPAPKPVEPAPTPVKPAPTATSPKPKSAKPAKPAPKPVEAAKPRPDSPKPAKPAPTATSPKPKPAKPAPKATRPKPKPAKPAKPAPKPVEAAKPPPGSPTPAKPAEKPPKPATPDNAEPGAPVALPTTPALAAATAQPGTADRRHSRPRPPKVKLPREPASSAQPGLMAASPATTVRVTAAASVRASPGRPAGPAFADPPPPPHPTPMPRFEIASATETGLDARQRAALPSLTAQSGNNTLTLLFLAIGLVGAVVSGCGLARGPASPRR
jgi:hypothetical protein